MEQETTTSGQNITPENQSWSAAQTAALILLIVLCCVIVWHSYSPEDVYISDLNYEVLVAEEYDPRDDATVLGSPLKIQVDEQPSFYAKGIGLHANSEIFIRFVPDGYTHFAAEIGIDAESATENSSVVFSVYSGGSEGRIGTKGTLLYESSVLKKNMNPRYIEIPVYGRRSITLTVTNAGDGIQDDFAIWSMARFIKR